jgi:CubicO group peptidase (beta-lactamase class C family)
MKAGRILVAAATAATMASAGAEAPQPGLGGLWSAKLRFGPDVEGPLLLIHGSDGWRGDIAGFSVPAKESDGLFELALPDGKGAFRGRRSGTRIVGQWIQERSATGGTAYATPLTLVSDGPARWRGEVRPLAETFTYYMPLSPEEKGYAAYLRNPERNQGRAFRAKRLELEGTEARLYGGGSGLQQAERLIASGSYRADRQTLTLPLRGASFDFARADEASSPFYPRGRQGERYRYRPPPRLADGWPVASVEEVGISREAIEKLVQMLIDMPMRDVETLQLHSLLIARHGKLVVEEYFHGYHRDVPHDIRSAGKSLTSTLIGAAIQAGLPLSEEMPVYETMVGTLPQDIDPRKRAMTLRHLMTMTSGHFCDDTNPEAPGNENVMQEQEAERDWYKYILTLPMDRRPGEKIIYCSADAVLAGGLVRKVAREPLADLIHRLVTGPLEMGPYHLNLTPTGEAYTAGGGYFRPRDFLKLPQLMLNGGVWKGKRILSRSWVEKARSPRYRLNPSQQFGYFWNIADYPYRGRNVRATFAAGNGGQIFMEIPELDLVVGFTGGSYNDPSALIPQRQLVPEHILPAVVESGAKRASPASRR